MIVAAPAVLVPAKLVKESAPLLTMMEFAAVEPMMKTDDEAEPVLLRCEVSADAVSLKRVCEFAPLLLIVAVPAFDVPKKLTTAAGNAPVPLLLIVAPPAVELSRKLIRPVELVLFTMAVPAVELL